MDNDNFEDDDRESDDDDGDDDDDDDDHDDHDDDFDDDYLCLSARVMYQSKTAVSGKTCRPQKCFLTIILFLICFLTINLFSSVEDITKEWGTDPP